MKQISWLSGLSATGQAAPPRVLADGVLRTIADREPRARQLFLREREEKVRLVLRCIHGALEEIAAARRIAFHAGVVARGHGLGAEPARPLRERGEFEIAVAVRAGQRRAAGCVLVHEIRDHVLFELLFEVEDVVRNPDRRGHAPRIVQIVNRAAAAERAPAGLRRSRRVIELHRQTDDVVALVGDKCRGHRRIDAARHGDDVRLPSRPFSLPSQATAASTRGPTASVRRPPAARHSTHARLPPVVETNPG